MVALAAAGLLGFNRSLTLALWTLHTIRQRHAATPFSVRNAMFPRWSKDECSTREPGRRILTHIYFPPTFGQAGVRH